MQKILRQAHFLISRSKHDRCHSKRTLLCCMECVCLSHWVDFFICICQSCSVHKKSFCPSLILHRRRIRVTIFVAWISILKSSALGNGLRIYGRLICFSNILASKTKTKIHDFVYLEYISINKPNLHIKVVLLHKNMESTQTHAS